MDASFNSQFYTFEKKTYDVGFLDACVDATYIIHLEGNGRLPRIQEQLTSFQPTRTVYLLHNPGFTNGKKKLIDPVSYHDINDAFLQCFSHADKQGYNNILILEDDFLFSERAKDITVVDRISHFLASKQGSPFVYYLGCFPLIVHPCDFSSHHYTSLKSFTAHSVIYSKEARTVALDFSYQHWDRILHHSIPHKYLYNEPLCYQTFPKTDHREKWISQRNFLSSTLLRTIFTVLNMETDPTFGFHLIYAGAKYIPLAAILVSLICIWFLYRFYLPFSMTNTNNHINIDHI